MKTRNGFVSNSSSSSFILIKPSEHKSKYEFNKEKFVFPMEDGMKEFGWGSEVIHDFPSKLNWCYAQMVSMYGFDFSEYIEEYVLLKKVLKDHFPSIKYFTEGDVCNLYIDHQSVGDRNCIAMFDNEISLRDFLFSTESILVLDNDNREADEEFDALRLVNADNEAYV